MRASHRVRVSGASDMGIYNRSHALITLPAFPGVKLSTDRGETAPTARMIKHPVVSPAKLRGAAAISHARRTADIFRAAISQAHTEGEFGL